MAMTPYHFLDYTFGRKKARTENSRASDVLEMHHFQESDKGFALLIAVIFMSVMLAFGLALASIGYKQEVLASAAIESQIAFYVADSALECGLYADEQLRAFDYTANANAPAPTMTCGSSVAASKVCQNITNVDQSGSSACKANSWRILNRIDFGTANQCADVTIIKPAVGTTTIFSQGYDADCATVANPNGARFTSRGLSTYYTGAISSLPTYATWNPSDTQAGETLSSGNLTVTKSGSSAWGNSLVRANAGVTTGKWYWEVKVNSGVYVMPGISKGTIAASYLGNDAYGWGWYITYDGQIYNNAATTACGSAAGAGTVLGFALDMNAGTFTGYKNGVFQCVIANGLQLYGPNNLGAYAMYPAVDLYDNGASVTANFDPATWAYPAPFGYSGLVPSATVPVYATLNPADSGYISPTPPTPPNAVTLSNGNLTITKNVQGWGSSWGGPTTNGLSRATFGKSSGKWYWEVTVNVDGETMMGISQSTLAGLYLGNDAFGWGWDMGSPGGNGFVYHAGGTSFSTAPAPPGTVLGFALDMTAGTLVGYKNGVQVPGYIGTGLSGTIYPAIQQYQAGTSDTMNFGASSFKYAPPNGFAGFSQ